MHFRPFFFVFKVADNETCQVCYHGTRFFKLKLVLRDVYIHISVVIGIIICSLVGNAFAICIFLPELLSILD